MASTKRKRNTCRRCPDPQPVYDIDQSFLSTYRDAGKLLSRELQYEKRYGGFPKNIPAVKKYIAAHQQDHHEAAALLVQAFVYVPEHTFIQKLKNACAAFRDQKEPGVDYFLITSNSNSGGDRITKSNWFYSQVAFPWLGPNVYPVTIRQYHAIAERAEPTEPTAMRHVVFVDDACYSAMQLKDLLITTLSNSDGTWGVDVDKPGPVVHVVIPYLLRKAYNRLHAVSKDVRLYEQQRMLTLAETLPEVMHAFYKAALHGTDLAKHFESNSTTYFYHKTADGQSGFDRIVTFGFPQLFATSTLFLLIRNCPKETKGRKRDSSSGKCPPPYYKMREQLEWVDSE